MSYDIVHRSRAQILENGQIALQVQAFSNNITPHPRRGFERDALRWHTAMTIDPAELEAGVRKLESFCASYDSGCIKENWQNIPGDVAYRRWVRRIRAVAPAIEIRPCRPSFVVYSHDAALRERKPVPAVEDGGLITADTAATLAAAGVFPKVKSTVVQFSGKSQYLAFVKDGRIYVSSRPGAARGYFAGECVTSLQAIAGVEPLPAITQADPKANPEQEVCFIRAEIEGQEPMIMDWLGLMVPLSRFKGDNPARPARFAMADGPEAVMRLIDAYPDRSWSALPLCVL